MLSRLIDRFDTWLVRRERQKLPAVDWESLASELAPIIEDHSIFMEPRFDGFVTLNAVQSGAIDADIVTLRFTLRSHRRRV